MNPFNPWDKHFTLAQELNEKHGHFLTTFDPNVRGTIIPEHLRLRRKVTLLWGSNLPSPVSDLDISWVGLTGTLDFGDKRYTCFIPWKAVTDVCSCKLEEYAGPLLEVIEGGGQRRSPPRGKLRRV